MITLTVRAQKSRNVFVDKTFGLVIAQQPAWVTSEGALPDAAVGDAVSYRLEATDAVTYAVILGKLPTAFTLSTVGILSGTAAEEQVSSFTVRATRSGTGSVFSDRSFVLTALSKPTWITGAQLGEFATGTEFSLALLAQNTAYFSGTGLPVGIEITSRGVLQGRVDAAWSGQIAVTAFRKATVFQGVSLALPLTHND